MASPSHPQILPFVPSVPYYRFRTSIENVAYIFDVRWNVRDAAWYFDLLETDETPIALGVKIVLGMSLARRIKHPLFRNGTLVAIDTSGKLREPGLDDLGTRVQIRYYTVYDIIAVIHSARKI